MKYEQEIWDYLYSKIKNAYGVAAVMGNLMAESSLNPACATGRNKTPNYVNDVDNRRVDFVHDSVAFGLVQWCYHTRKEGLLNYAKSRSIGDLQMQLEYLVKEMSEKYKTVWSSVINATDIRTCSDVVMLKYEKPANTSEAAKQKRAEYGRQFYSKFSTNREKIEPKTASKYVVVQTNRVNIRSGNSTEFSKVSQANKDNIFEWVATAENGWHAIKLPDRVAWISGEFTSLK